MSKNKTQTIPINILVKKKVIKFLLFSDLPSYNYHVTNAVTMQLYVVAKNLDD
jgi:hypothetical protein